MGSWLPFASSLALLCLSHLPTPSGFMLLQGGRCTIRFRRLRFFTPISTALRDACVTFGAMQASAFEKKRDLCVTCSDHRSMPRCTPHLRLFIPSRAVVLGKEQYVSINLSHGTCTQPPSDRHLMLPYWLVGRWHIYCQSN